MELVISQPNAVHRSLAPALVLLLTLALSSTCCDVVAAPANSAAAKSGSFTYQGVRYPNIVRVPSGYEGSQPLPALLLIHGAGGKGQDMVNLWESFADSHHIILVAPTLPLDAEFEKLVPRLFPALMDSVKQQWNVDPNRIYVFGYSAGGYVTFDAATLASTYFAAAAVFADIIAPEYYQIIQQAQRRTPIAIYIGDHDQYFSVKQVQATRDRLVANGFPVHFVVVPHQDHNYAAASVFVNSDAWQFMSQYSLGH
jgi:poly(3-hydroxybutyrate) depolymerase